jgi:hypothetical protein
MTTPKLKWERIDNYTDRAKVFGGWLVRSYSERATFQPVPIAMCFVPDEHHVWGVL